MFKNKIIIIALVILTTLGVSAFSGIDITSTNESKSSMHNEFSSLDSIAGSVAASAMTRFYEVQASRGSLIGDLTTLSASDISAYRWNAMAKFYADLASQGGLTGDLTTLSASDISAYRWNAMAEFYAAQNESLNVRQVFLTSPGR